jgi:NADPH:quinone reductase-like Zn-dependent oxidoreductase
MKALTFSEFGKSDVLQYTDLPEPTVGYGEVLVRMQYIGLNFADIYRRRGMYHLEKRQPYVNGYEGAGDIVAIGKDVANFTIGETVLFVDVPLANAEFVVIPAANAIRLPKDIDAKLAASIGLQGLTADFLAHDLGRALPGDKVFVHGISGGVGQILSQMLTADGLQVTGMTSTVAKQQVALAQGAQQVVLRENIWDSHLAEQFETVYDGVGVTLGQSIGLAKKRGKIVFFGMAGGVPPQIDFVKLLAESKSILTGDLWDYLTNFDERQARSARLFDYVRKGKIKISEPTVFSLKEGKMAHDYLESGKSIGKILMVP